MPFRPSHLLAIVLLFQPLCGVAAGTTQLATAWPKIRVGMNAAEVRRTIGDPCESKPFTLPDGAGECWIYRRPVSRRQTDLQINQRPMMEADEGCMTQPPQFLPVYAAEIIDVEQVTALFVRNNRLVAAKQWCERNVRQGSVH